MARSLFRLPLALTLFLLAVTPATPQGKFGEQAPDFPPGVFTDGNSYSLSSLQGRVVVLYFFEPK